MISRHSIVVASQDQVSSELSGEAVILNLRNGTYYGLDAVGATIWGLIQEPRSIEAIHTALLEQYDVEPERCERDLLALLQELAAAELVEVRDAPAA